MRPFYQTFLWQKAGKLFQAWAYGESMNIQNRDIMDCLPLLASVLGDKYGVEIRIGGEEAKTNGKVIYIPSLPVDMDTEAMDTAKGYVDHEAAHIRHTDFGLLNNTNLDAITKWLFNAIEDWRVENKLAVIFPGCRHNFHKLIVKLLGGEKNTKAGNENPAFDILQYILLKVRSWDAPALREKQQGARGILEKSFPGISDDLDKILAKTRRNCPDTQAALDYAKQLAACMGKWKPPHLETEKFGKHNDYDRHTDLKPSGKAKPFYNNNIKIKEVQQSAHTEEKHQDTGEGKLLPINLEGYGTKEEENA